MNLIRMDVPMESRERSSSLSMHVEVVPRGATNGVRRAAGTTCERCGSRSRVHVLESYAGGAPQVRRFCLPCADRWSSETSRGGALKPRPGIAALLAMAGAAMLIVGLLGDYLFPDARAGFGRHQQLGVLVGAVLILVGIVLRVQIIALGATLLFIVALGADWLRLTHGIGIGWKQVALIVFGAATLLMGAVYPFLREWVVRRAARAGYVS